MVVCLQGNIGNSPDMQQAVFLNWVRVDRDAPPALYEQISDQVRDAILEGHLVAGARLPASRSLAADLGVSRITTTQAYEQLVAEGFLETKRGSGTRVSRQLSVSKLANLAEARKPVRDPIDKSEKHILTGR